MAELTTMPGLEHLFGGFLGQSDEPGGQSEPIGFAQGEKRKGVRLDAENRTSYSISAELFAVIHARLQRLIQKRDAAEVTQATLEAGVGRLNPSQDSACYIRDMTAIRRLMFEANVAMKNNQGTIPKGVWLALDYDLRHARPDDIFMFLEGFDNAEFARSHREGDAKPNLKPYTLIGTKFGAIQWSTSKLLGRQVKALTAIQAVGTPQSDLDHDKNLAEVLALFRDKDLDTENPDRINSIVVAWPLATQVADFIQAHAEFLVQLCLNNGLAKSIKRTLFLDGKNPNFELLDGDFKKTEVVPVPPTVLSETTGPGHVVAEDNVASPSQIEDNSTVPAAEAKPSEAEVREAHKAAQRALQKEKKARLKANRKAAQQKVKDEDIAKKSNLSNDSPIAEGAEKPEQTDFTKKLETVVEVKEAESAKKVQTDLNVVEAEKAEMAKKFQMDLAIVEAEKAEKARKIQMDLDVAEAKRADLIRKLQMATEDAEAKKAELAKIQQGEQGEQGNKEVHDAKNAELLKKQQLQQAQEAEDARKAEFIKNQQMAKDAEDAKKAELIKKQQLEMAKAKKAEDAKKAALVKRQQMAKQAEDARKAELLKKQQIAEESKKAAQAKKQELAQKAAYAKKQELARKEELAKNAEIAAKKQQEARDAEIANKKRMDEAAAEDKLAQTLGGSSLWKRSYPDEAFPPLPQVKKATASGGAVKLANVVPSSKTGEISDTSQKKASTSDLPKLDTGKTDNDTSRSSLPLHSDLKISDNPKRSDPHQQKPKNPETPLVSQRIDCPVTAVEDSHSSDEAKLKSSSLTGESSLLDIAKTREAGKMERRNSINFIRSRTDSRASMLQSPLASASQGPSTPITPSPLPPPLVNEKATKQAHDDQKSLPTTGGHTAAAMGSRMGASLSNAPGSAAVVAKPRIALNKLKFGDVDTDVDVGAQTTSGGTSNSSAAASTTARQSTQAVTPAIGDITSAGDQSRTTQLPNVQQSREATATKDPPAVAKSAKPVLRYTRQTPNDCNKVKNRSTFLRLVSKQILDRTEGKAPGGEIVTLSYQKAHASGGGHGTIDFVLPERRTSSHKRGASISTPYEGFYPQLEHPTT